LPLISSSHTPFHPSFITNTATTNIYTLSLHDALPIFPSSTLTAMLSRMPTVMAALTKSTGKSQEQLQKLFSEKPQLLIDALIKRSEEHTSELQSRENLVCRLLLEKKNNIKITHDA